MVTPAGGPTQQMVPHEKGHFEFVEHSSILYGESRKGGIKDMSGTAHVGAVVSALTVMLLLSSVAGAIEYGPNLLVNGGFEQDKDGDGVPDGWLRSVQDARAEAEVVLQDGGVAEGSRCVRIRFLSPDYMHQARLIQHVKIEPGTVYEISFCYRSALHPGLHADILMTGTGPMYRGIAQMPIAGWVRKREMFLIPASVRGTKPKDIGEVGEAVICIQNRSTVPIWYDDVSFRATDLTLEELQAIAPELRLHPRTAADTAIFPRTGLEEVRFIPHARVGAGKIEDALLELWLATEDDLVPLGSYESRGTIRIPVESLPYGPSRLIAMMLKKGEPFDEVLACHEQTIERFSADEIPTTPDPADAPVLTDRDQRFFPIGMYGMQIKWPEEWWRELVDHGFNVVHDYGFGGGPENLEADLRYLDRAQRLGLRVMAQLPRSLAEGEDGLGELKEWLREISRHPDILFYYSDEMVSIRHTPLQRVAAVRELMRQVDPKRKYLPFDTWERGFLAHVDGLLTWCSTRSMALLLRGRLGPNKPWIAVPNVSYRAQEPPDRDEQRYQTFMPVILGARGVFYWMYSEAKYHSGDPDYLGRLLDSAKELSQIAPAVISGEDLPDWTPDLSASRGISRLICTLDGRVYVLGGPSDPEQRGRLRFELPAGIRAKILFEAPKRTWEGPERVKITVPRRRVKVIELSR